MAMPFATRFTLILFTLFTSTLALSQSRSDTEMLSLLKDFEKRYGQFAIPGLTLDFKVNLRNELQTLQNQEQKDFFSGILERLGHIDKTQLSEDLHLDFGILDYEARLNLERLALLEKPGEYSKIAQLESIYQLTQGPAWYAWFVKKWTGTTMSPEQVLNFGKKEVERVKHQMSLLDLSSPKPTSDFTHDLDLIISTLNSKKEYIASQLGTLLPEYANLPGLNIQRGTNPAMAQTPGYYNSNTFYFNLFDKPFDLADCDWLLIHEGNPGHHFQVNFHNDLPIKSYRANLRYMGFVEGWAAYTENLGWEMGLYKSPYEALGKWKWDIIRSVRIVLDAGLNYYGWTDQEALAYWQLHIKDQDDIALREIARMKRWPAQVLTYKMGEAAILKALEAEKQRLGDVFSYKNFHARILGSGTIPVALIPQLIKYPL
ncbi:MAG: hypothetical protein Roseis2KO_44660 [Roseivirga sp.]